MSVRPCGVKQWHYSQGGQQQGPVPQSQLEELIRNGLIDPNKDLVWAEGMAEWVSPTAAGLGGGGTSVSAPTNPYASPLTQPDAAVSSGTLPFVKPANYGLMVSLIGAGFLGLILGFVLLNDQSTEAPGIIALIISFLIIIAGFILSVIYLYRAWVLLQPHTPHSTPGKAVGFLFIPLFHFYWYFVAFWRWSQEWNRIVAGNPQHAAHAPRASEGLFLTYAILKVAGIILGALAVVPSIVIFFIILKQVCNAVNYGAAHSHPA